MDKIEPKRLLELARPVVETEYYKKNSDLVNDFIDFIKDIEEGEDTDYYEDEDIYNDVELLVIADETIPLPEEIKQLVYYVFGIAVENGDSDTMVNYGNLYYDGRLGEQDFNKAAYYYERALALGNENAATNLGYIYYYGRTGNVDYQRAFDMFFKAAVAYGDPISTYKLGDMYKKGYYVEKDENTAFLCYKKAEDIVKSLHYDDVYDEDDINMYDGVYDYHEPDIYLRLGEAYEEGMGTEKNLQKALEYYQKAEPGFISNVRDGNYMLKKRLVECIEREEAVRKEIMSNLPEMEWAKDKTGYDSL